MAGLEIVRGADREALRYISIYSRDIGDSAVWKGEDAVWSEGVGCSVVLVADLDEDGAVGVGGIGSCVRGGEAGEGCVGLIGEGGDGPPLPVDGTVFEVGDLWGEGGVDVEGETWGKAETEVAEDGDLVCAAVAGEEGVGGMGATVGGEVIGELFGELEPWCAGVGLFRILLVGVGGTAGGGDGTGDDAEDGVGHPRAV